MICKGALYSSPCKTEIQRAHLTENYWKFMEISNEFQAGFSEQEEQPMRHILAKDLLHV